MGMIGTMNDPVGQISAQLRGRGVVLPRDNEWLIACIDCYISNNPNYTENELYDFVFEQWTLADLADVGAPSLPPSCANCTKMMLTGKYAVQINYFLNVAVPLHKQLQRIRRPEAHKNLEVDNERQEREKDRKENSSARALKMEITDGVTTVIGFEDQPIPAIACPVPGEKAVLSGPIEVRKGVLMLKPANVTMLGGEVDVLLVKNHQENLLARALKQPENPDPYGVNPALRDSAVLVQAPAPPQSAPAPRSAPAPPPPPRAPMSAPNAPNLTLDAFEDGEDEALASLAEALENDSFHLEDSPANTPPNPVTRPSIPSPANRPAIRRTTTSSKTLPNKQSSEKPPKQPSITAFLTQPTKPSSQVFDISSEIELFDDDFELIAAETASLAEQQARSKITVNSHNPEKLKKQLEETYAVGVDSSIKSRPATTAAVPRVGATIADSSTNSRQSSHPAFPRVGATTADSSTNSRQSSSAALSRVAASSGDSTDPGGNPNKRKDTVELDLFGRPKVPRNESTSSTSSEAPQFKNPRHSVQDELMDSEELYDWLPPPPKANLEHVRPSHEKGKILVDYTDASTLDLDSVSTQKTQQGNLKTAPKPALLEEPFPPKEFPCTRTALGKVIKVVNKLQLKDAKWVLSAIVQARGIELEMDFSPEALDKIFTVTAEEITRQKEHLKKNPELKEKFNGHLRESQKRIQTLHCQMTIHFKNFISKPVVVDVSEND